MMTDLADIPEDARITVDGIAISQAQINEEVQYHPADKLMDAKHEAMQALVVRELLLQEAVRQGLCDRDGAITKADDVIEQLLSTEIKVPEPDDVSCSRYFENNQRRFATAPLFEVSHIFFPAPPSEKIARERAKGKAVDSLEKINANPYCFNEIARKESSCSSSVKGGHLGQISKGQTVPAFEAAVMTMEKGQISSVPVETEVGFHIIKIHERIDGKNLPFETVKDWIAHYLSQQSWNNAVSQYVQILAGKAKISGFDLKSADTPLVQ